MKDKLNSFFAPKLAFLKKKWKLVLLVVVILLVVVSKIIPDGFDPKTEIVEQVKLQNLQKTVKATGDVTSVVNLELSFNNPGRVQSVNVVLGQKVYKGQVLASLNAGSELGQLNQAYGALKLAEAALARTIEGSTTEEVRVAQVSLENAKRSFANTEKLQDTLVYNARANLYSSDLRAISSMASSTSTAPTITGKFTGSSEDEYTINIYQTGAGGYAGFTSTSGESGSFPISTSGPIPLGSKGLFIQFPSTIVSNENWKIKIPNTSSSTYGTNLSALNSAIETRLLALETAQAGIDSAEANLALKKAAARPSDIAAKEADVLIAQGRVQAAQGVYEEKIIRAPMDGYITKLDINAGENVESKQVAIVLQDKGSLFLEADINEADIGLINMGQAVTFTVDTLGSSEIFMAEVTHIDGSPTKDGNIVNFKIKAKIITGGDKIKNGSTANLSILIQEKSNIVTVPNRTVYADEETGEKYVLLVTNEKSAKTMRVPVTIGFQGDGALTEITSGLNGDEKVLFKTE